MSVGIRAEEAPQRCRDANESRQSSVTLAAIILKLREDLFGSCMIASHPQDDHEDKKADSMNNHEYPFRYRKLSCAEDVECSRGHQEQHDKQRRLPQRIHTRIRVPQQHQPPHQRRRELCSRRTSRDPS